MTSRDSKGKQILLCWVGATTEDANNAVIIVSSSMLVKGF